MIDIRSMGHSDRSRMRELYWQLGTLLVVAVSTWVLRSMTREGADGGIMTATVVVAMLLVAITVKQISAIVHREHRMLMAERRREAAEKEREERIAAEAAIAEEERKEREKEKEIEEAVKTASSAHVVDDASSPTSEFREMVEHDSRTIRLPQKPKGPTMVYCPD